MSKYDLKYIDKLRIHELRDFARTLGIASPTTLKKDELVCKITAIVGKDDNFDNNNMTIKRGNDIDFFSLLVSDNSNILTNLLSLDKKGHSNKKSTKELDCCSNSAIINNNFEWNTEEDFSKIDRSLKMSFKLSQNETLFTDDDVFSVQGFVDIHPSGYGILRYNGFVPCDADSYFTSSLVKKHNLNKGDFIVGNAKYVMKGKPRIVFEITKVEPISNNKINRNFSELMSNGLGNEIYIEKFKLSILKGERHYIEKMTLKDAFELGLNIVEENDSYVKFVNIKSAPEDERDSIDKLQIINIPFIKNELEVINAVELVVERIKREFEQEKSNVLIIYNFSELIRILNCACEGAINFNKFNTQALNKMYNILYVSKYLDEKSNVSVICIDKNGVARDLKDLLEFYINPLFNKMHESV